ncbi:MAG: DUF4097 family beta strand repeat-containing protein [Candidatus Eiseniibacteriota bacterium]
MTRTRLTTRRFGPGPGFGPGLGLLTLIVAGFGLAPAAFAAEEEFYWKGPLAAGKTIEIRGVNGPIRAEAATGREVEVRAIKRAKKDDPSEVRIETVEHADGVTICALYPNRKGKPPNTCDADGGHNSSEDCDVWVRFTVRVPAGVKLVARTVNGDVEASGLTASVEATTVNGSIDVATKSYAEATTVNGEIEIEMASSGWPAGLDFRTVNGSIQIEMTGTVNADIEAETLNGSIESDFPLTVAGRVNHNKLRGKLGDGGPRLELSTVNGNIELRRTPS